MQKLRIKGGKPLDGSVRISGAKNAALPLIAASLLTSERVVLSNIPDLTDVRTMCNLLSDHGGYVKNHVANKTDNLTSGNLIIECRDIDNYRAHYDLVKTMRASVLVLGPLLSRFGEAEVSLPGGCAIGARPVDMHLKALELMGTDIEIKSGYIHAKLKDKSKNRLQGAIINFDKISVGATENIMMAACLAEGKTEIINAAREPEIKDLANMLMGMGANIIGAGSDKIEIIGSEKLGGVEHRAINDRIEIGSYIAFVAAATGQLELIGAEIDCMESVIDKFIAAGVMIEKSDNGLIVKCERGDLIATDIETASYPGFPTDMQAQFTAAMSLAKGKSVITENIFENRFMHIPELRRMGADIIQKGKSVVVTGVENLRGAEIMATDLRASISLVAAALAADGETVIGRIYHLMRGYEHIEKKLSACGADIEII